MAAAATGRSWSTRCRFLVLATDSLSTYSRPCANEWRVAVQITLVAEDEVHLRPGDGGHEPRPPLSADALVHQCARAQHRAVARPVFHHAHPAGVLVERGAAGRVLGIARDEVQVEARGRPRRSVEGLGQEARAAQALGLMLEGDRAPLVGVGGNSVPCSLTIMAARDASCPFIFALNRRKSLNRKAITRP